MHLCQGKFAYLIAVMAALLCLTPALALAKPKVEVKQTVTKEVTVIENGRPVVKIVAAAEAAPGEILFITLVVSNQGDEPATNLVFDNPVPDGATYVNGSAKGPDADIAFSIDQGKNYKKPALLTYELTLPDGRKEKRVASPEEYTHLRWTLPTLSAGDTVELQFSAAIRK